MALSAKNAQALEARGIDAEKATKYGVEDSAKPGFDVSIPYLVGGVTVNHKYRTLGPDKRFCQDEGGRKVLWNFDVLTDSTLDGPLLITEGEFDALIAMQCGYPRVVSVPDGAPAEEQGAAQGAKYSYLAEALPTLQPFMEIILCTDGDGPGANLLNDLALRLGKARCKWVRYPKGCKDLNDTFQRYGERGVTETLSRAQWMKVDGIYRMSELPPLTYAKPHNVGIVGLEPHFNIRLGDFTVCTGIPGHGKSTFLNNIAGNMINLHGWKVAMASFEQKPQADHKRNLRTFHGEKLAAHLSPEEIAEADAWIDESFIFIVPNEDDEITLEWVLERASAAVVRHECKLVIIDPWNEMDHARPLDMTLTEYTGFAIKQFKKFAAKHRVHVIVAAHPAKMQRIRGKDEISIPSLYDISDSAHWYNKPDAGIVIHRQGDDTLIRVVKSRYYTEIGVPGQVVASFDRARNRYTVVERDATESAA